MSKFNSGIVLICEDDDVAKSLKARLSSLRKNDAIKRCKFEVALKTLEKKPVALVIIYLDNEYEKYFDLVTDIKSNSEMKNSSVLVICENLEEDLIIAGFDAGVDDFYAITSSDGELLMRLISGFKKNKMTSKISAQDDVLADFNIKDSQSGFYTTEYGKYILENEMKKIVHYQEEASFMVITPDINSIPDLPSEDLAQIIKDCIRDADKVAFGDENKFYIILNQTNKNDAINLFDRINEKIPQNCKIYSGVCEIKNASFLEVAQEALNALSNAFENNENIIVTDEDGNSTPINWLDKGNSGKKNFKLFKQAFLKKLENVITPVFYQFQTIWEDKLFNTQIKQYSNESESVFILEDDDNNKNILKITYPGFAKINIDIEKSYDTETPKTRISIELSEMNERKLSEILTTFIKEYQIQSND